MRKWKKLILLGGGGTPWIRQCSQLLNSIKSLLSKTFTPHSQWLSAGLKIRKESTDVGFVNLCQLHKMHRCHPHPIPVVSKELFSNDSFTPVTKRSRYRPLLWFTWKSMILFRPSGKRQLSVYNGFRTHFCRLSLAATRWMWMTLMVFYHFTQGMAIQVILDAANIENNAQCGYDYMMFSDPGVNSVQLCGSCSEGSFQSSGHELEVM